MLSPSHHSISIVNIIMYDTTEVSLSRTAGRKHVSANRVFSLLGLKSSSVIGMLDRD